MDVGNLNGWELKDVLSIDEILKLIEIKYKVEEIRNFDFSNFISFIAFLIMMSVFTLGFIYFATN